MFCNYFKMALCLFMLLSLNMAIAYQAPFVEQAPQVDGIDDEAIWSKAQWQQVDQLTLGSMPTPEDFSARFKVVWTQEKLYLLAEIVDDVLIDSHPDPLDSYWEDDTFEIFIDEDKSGGDHLNNYNAFAYHVALDNQVIDINNKGQAQRFNNHVESVWKRSNKDPYKVIWELSINIYSDHSSADEIVLEREVLEVGKEMGFLVAYCDSDGENGREHFLSSIDVPAINGDKNRAYIDASVFDSLLLIE